MSSSTTASIPIVICGNTTRVGKMICELLLPEYEVIHFTTSYEEIEAELPAILAGRDPQSPNSYDVGTHNYNKPPVAMVLGRAFQPAQGEELREKCEGYAKGPVIWLVGDPAKYLPPPYGPDYAAQTAAQVKEALGGGLAKGIDGVLLF